VRDSLKPLIDAITEERPTEEIDRLSGRLVPKIWNEALQEAAPAELRVSLLGAVEYYLQIEAAIADLEERRGRSMTARCRRAGCARARDRGIPGGAAIRRGMTSAGARQGSERLRASG
jgi:hypothetical protein